MTRGSPFAVALLAMCLAPAAIAQVTYYGAPGSFVGLRDPLPSQHPVSTEGVSSWQTDPGQTFFFTDVTSDGTVFVSNMVQTLNPLLGTACSTVVTCFNPDVPTCFDAATGSAEHFSNIRIPTRGGDIFVPPDVDCSTLGRGPAGDISDVEVNVDPVFGERVLWVSYRGSISNRHDATAAIGAISHNGIGWALDEGSMLTPMDLQAGPAGALACPNQAAFCATDADCPGGTCDFSQPFYGLGRCDVGCATSADCASGQTCLGGRCGNPSCGGMNEQDTLPVSGRIVTTHYGGARISVMDAAGSMLAVHQLPDIEDPCNPGTHLLMSPREVATDPTGRIGDERFVVVYDTSFKVGALVQELNWDETTRSLAATSSLFVPHSDVDPIATCASQVRNGSKPVYDLGGNLWIATSHGFGYGATHVYQRNASGRRSFEDNCFIDPATGLPYAVGRACKSDIDLGAFYISRATRQPAWGYGWAGNSLLDVSRDRIYVNGMNGIIGILQPTNKDYAFAASGWVHLDIYSLPIGPNRIRFSNKGSLDEGNRRLWKPVSTGVAVSPCGFFDCVYEVGAVAPDWLAALDVDAIAHAAIELKQVSASRRKRQDRTLVVGVKTDYTAGLAGLDTQISKLYVYHEGSSVPDARIEWEEGPCVPSSCVLNATIDRSLTRGHAGEFLSWHAVLRTNEQRPRSLHVAGRTEIVR